MYQLFAIFNMKYKYNIKSIFFLSKTVLLEGSKNFPAILNYDNRLNARRVFRVSMIMLVRGQSGTWSLEPFGVVTEL